MTFKFKSIVKFLVSTIIQFSLVLGVMAYLSVSVIPDIKNIRTRVNQIENTKLLINDRLGNTKSIIDQSYNTVVEIMSGKRSGTGFMVDKTGLIITNAHVVGKNKSAEIRFNKKAKYFKGKKLSVTVVALDEERDLALLKINRKHTSKMLSKGEYFDYLELATPNESREGAIGIAIGHPLNTNHVSTLGMISKLLGYTCEEGITTVIFYADVAIFPGNSGGPLIDVHTGKVLGVMGFAISKYDLRITGGTHVIHVSEMLTDYKKRRG